MSTEPMYITDLEGVRIKVTNLELALQQAGSFKELIHVNPAFAELDRKLHAYWQDVYAKLLVLRDKENSASGLG